MIRCFESLKHNLKINNSIYFHALGIFDKYLESIKDGDKEEDLILVVITTLFLANKFENQNIDSIEELAIEFFRKSQRRKKYYKFEIFEKEMKVLHNLKYTIYFPTVYFFYNIGKTTILDKEEEMFLKISFLNYEIVKNYKPSIISMAISKIKDVSNISIC